MINISYQALNCGKNGSGISGLITIDKKSNNNELVILDRCLINVGDLTQRFCLDNQIKLNKLSLVIITAMSPHCISGLPGIIHALANLGNEKLTIMGPNGIKVLIDIITPFTNRKYPIITCIEINSTHSINNPYNFNINLFSGFILPISSTQLDNVLALSGYISTNTSNDHGISFISIPGYFDIKPDINETINHIKKNRNNFLYLFIPIGMINMKSYINKYQAVCDQLEVNGIIYDLELSNTISELKAAQVDISIWNKLCPSLFNHSLDFIANDSTATLDIVESLELTDIFAVNSLVSAEPFMTYSYRYNIECTKYTTNYMKLVSRNKEIRSQCQSKSMKYNNNQCIENSSIRSNNSKREINDNIKSNDLSVTFLGTGSATPSKHRNNTSILIKFIDKSILLDLGEGTVSQLYYHCSGDITRYSSILLSIRLIWISHYHGDHIAGFPMLMQQIYQYKCVSNRSLDKILVIVPSNIVKEYFEYVSCICGFDDMITIININETLYINNKQLLESYYNDFIHQLVSVPVYHCVNAYAVIITFANDTKICYSGDCRPNNNLTRLGLNCDLLIHEATFDNNMSTSAINKKHCTIDEALSISRQMKAKYTFLTHFSQRYPTIPNLEDSCKDISYGIAFDYLTFPFPYEIDRTIHLTNQLVQIIQDSNNSDEII